MGLTRDWICALCFKSNHRGYNVILLQKEYEAMTIDNEAEKEKGISVQVFADLIPSIQSKRAKLVDVIEERLSADKAQGLRHFHRSGDGSH